MHYSIDSEEIKNEIAKLGHKVSNIWNVKHYLTKQPLSMFLIDLLPAPNNKVIYNMKSLQQCKIRFESHRHSRNIAQYSNCQRYEHTKNFCHLKHRRVKCASDHSTCRCSRKERSSVVWCVLCNGNHPANYKCCTVYKDLQKILSTPPTKTIHSSRTTTTNTAHPTWNLLPHKILTTSPLCPNSLMVETTT
jgi:hypothetical protein